MDIGVPGRPGLPAVKHAAAEQRVEHGNVTILPHPAAGQIVSGRHRRQLLVWRVTVQVGFNRELTQKGKLFGV